MSFSWWDLEFSTYLVCSLRWYWYLDKSSLSWDFDFPSAWSCCETKSLFVTSWSLSTPCFFPLWHNPGYREAYQRIESTLIFKQLKVLEKPSWVKNLDLCMINKSHCLLLFSSSSSPFFLSEYLLCARCQICVHSCLLDIWTWMFPQAPCPSLTLHCGWPYHVVP